MGRLVLVFLPILSAVGAVFSITVLAPYLVPRSSFPSNPPQPIFFDHQLHVQQVGLQCQFCHRTADQGVSAGMPDVQQCMFCHQSVGASDLAAARSSVNPQSVPAQQPMAAVQGQSVPDAQALAEIQKLRQSWQSGQPIDWARIHRLPDHVRFTHQAHIQAGVQCQTCHGDVAAMQQVQQVRPLKMADCVACHQQNSAPTDCDTCHY